MRITQSRLQPSMMHLQHNRLRNYYSWNHGIRKQDIFDYVACNNSIVPVHHSVADGLKFGIELLAEMRWRVTGRYMKGTFVFSSLSYEVKSPGRVIAAAWPIQTTVRLTD